MLERDTVPNRCLFMYSIKYKTCSILTFMWLQQTRLCMQLHFLWAKWKKRNPRPWKMYCCLGCVNLHCIYFIVKRLSVRYLDSWQTVQTPTQPSVNSLPATSESNEHQPGTGSQPVVHWRDEEKRAPLCKNTQQNLCSVWSVPKGVCMYVCVAVFLRHHIWQLVNCLSW